MKRLIIFSGTLLLAAAVFAFNIVSPLWKITEKYNVAFSSNEVGGIFKSFKGTINFDEANLAVSNFDVTVDVASIQTGNALQNKHAKSDEWFDAAKFPVIHYVSKKIVKAGAGYQVTGDLEIHGVKKEFTIPFNFVRKGNAATFNGTFNVNRNDFHIGKPGGDVADVIKVELAVPVTK
ncbi:MULTISPECIES: YceI family protein [unclassified Chitinophaga]|uniref:YceI family protein n=1 Tax=unclassified Chitinophaga TaxID=2619133 RepID=UPI0009CC2D7C|nr:MULTISPECIES: YceI family protein [unclassified Chitinophaga]OMP77757.1 polyisoprenoid-binding protein [[Flexibacter] sp. ATCC 35208]WPV65574.1 YceI family protein [Chitinophaga sp. LS1]